jgi:hypothetical protein
MRRLILIWIFFHTFFNVYSQIGEYAISITGSISHDNWSSRCRNEVFIRLFDQNGWKFYDHCKGTIDDYLNEVTYVSATSKLSMIELQGVREWRGMISGCNGNDETESHQVSITSASTNYYFNPPNWRGDFRFFIYPRELSMSSRNPYTGRDNDILPTDDKIELNAIKGFTVDTYRWCYSFNNSNWIELPAWTQGLETIQISARDFLTNEEIENNLNSNIFFSLRPAIAANVLRSITKIKTLTIRLSAPHIQSVGYDLESCYNANDAKINIVFDRALRSGERLYLSLNANEFRESGRIGMGSSNIGTVSGVSAGTYNMSLLGIFSISGTDTIFTFTDGARHNNPLGVLNVKNRPAMSLSLAQNSVHCRNGMDGKINLTVSGGNEQYTAYLLDANQTDTLKRMAIGSPNVQYTFSDLYKGNYYVYIKDSKGCDLDINNRRVQQSATVAEPADTVRLWVNAFDEATGYGRATGWAEVGITGGSAGYAAAWKNWNDDPVASQAFTSIGSATFSKAENLRSGWYYARVEDQNYNLAYPRTEVNLRGCYDTTSVFIDQPPKIIVDLEETHYVTCYGFNDGQLMAHTTGGRPFTYAKDARTLPYNYEWFKVEGGTDIPIGVNDSILRDVYRGYYKVKVTDRNAIDTISLVFDLVQPDTLIAKAQALKQVLCDGDKTGKAEAIVTGGTAPYTYQWTTGETTKIIDHLERDIYTVFVTDSRLQCTAEAHVSIKSPQGIVLNSILQNPTCYNYTDGKIELDITGGVEPYLLEWDDGYSTLNRTNLSKGDYSLKVTDANQCVVSEAYSLSEPEPIIVDLGKDISLCVDQTVTVDGMIDSPNMSYQWTDQHNNLLSNDSKLDISQAGEYKLVATDLAGCYGEDKIQVEQSTEVLKTDFVISSVIPKNKQIHAVNIINTPTDSIEWLLPEDVFVYEKTSDKVCLMFPQTGEYLVGLRSSVGKCEDILYKTVQVVNQSEVEEYTDAEPFLKRFTVAPNPTDGNFSVWVELRQPSDYDLFLYNESGVLVESKQVKNKEIEQTVFTRNDLSAGVYYLRFVSKEYISSFKIIVK